ncbi:MAG TPA: lysine--tRNA ligase [Gemmataceae bacterium]|nr:lysine--tRNA ligase [Gemmataceae bacterium]
MANAPEVLEASRLEKLRQIEALGLDPWGGRFDGVMPIAQVRDLPVVEEKEKQPKVRVAGRIRLRRGHGNLHFLHLWDQTGEVQIAIGKKQVGDLNWKLAQCLDLGDLLGVDGTFGPTKTGELTVFADGLKFLAKSLEPHPDKHKGLQDVELRQRQRYLDLIYHPETLARAHQRVKIIRTIRNYLDGQGFYEVETPVLQTIAGGAAARPFITHHNALDIDLYLRIALELHLKRLLVGGVERVYEIGRVFRNEGIDRKHNPEFTMLELYQAYGDYRSMMDLTEGVIVACVDALGGGRKRKFGEKEIDFTPPWQRACYADLFHTHVGVRMDDEAGVRNAATANQIVAAGKHHDVLVHQLFEHCVEDKLTGPVFVYDYPAALCPLTKRKNGDPTLAERFELYIHGMELANAYTELNDPITQEATFRQQLAGLPEEESMAKMDEDFVRALRHGMPPAGGLGIGIDRLCMLLTDTLIIGDVILFPLLRPEAKK